MSVGPDIAFLLFLQTFDKGRSQNLKEVPQNLMETFNVDDVTANDVTQKNQHR